MAKEGFQNTQNVNMPAGTGTLKTLDSISVVISHNEYSAGYVRLSFNWKFVRNGRLILDAPVTGFTEGDITFSPDITVVPNSFSQHSNSHYSIIVQYQPGTARFTTVVRKDSAQLIINSSVFGPNLPVTYEVELVPNSLGVPLVEISIEESGPIAGSPNALFFDWKYSDGTRAYIDSFTSSDVDIPEGFELSGMRPLDGDYSRYTATLSIPQDATDSFDITVKKESAAIRFSRPIVTAPQNDTTERFTITKPQLTSAILADKVCDLLRDIISNEYLNSVIDNERTTRIPALPAGGAFSGVLECKGVGDLLYLVVQIQKHIPTIADDGSLTDQPLLSNDQAGAALFRVDLNECNPDNDNGWELIKAYSDVTKAARSLVFKGNDLYFFEGSHYAYEDHIFFYDEDWRSKIGHLYRIQNAHNTGSFNIEDLGINWRSATTEDNPDDTFTDYFYGVHGGTASPMIVDGDDIHLITGYGNFNKLNTPIGDEESKDADNWSWIKYSNEVNRNIPELITNDKTRYDLLREIASVTDSVIRFTESGMRFEPREYAKGKFVRFESDGTLVVDNVNRETITKSRFVRIKGEIISFPNQVSIGDVETNINMPSRAQEGTEEGSYTSEDEVIFVDDVISLNQRTMNNPINNIDLSNDYHQFYNKIVIDYGADLPVVAKDEESIKMFGERALDLTIPLDAHQTSLAQSIADSYLIRFGKLKQVVDITLKSSFHIEVGDVVVVYVSNRVHLSHTLKAVEIRQKLAEKETVLKLQTL